MFLTKSQTLATLLGLFSLLNASPLPRQYEEPLIPRSATLSLTLSPSDETQSYVGHSFLSIKTGALTATDPSYGHPLVGSVTTPNVYCRAYADINGVTRVGGAFTYSHPYNYEDAHDGDGIVPEIQAYCCVGTPHGFDVCESGPRG